MAHSMRIDLVTTPHTSKVALLRHLDIGKGRIFRLQQDLPSRGR